MGLELELIEGILRARLSGRFGGEDAPKLSAGVFGRLPQSKRVIINLAMVDYVSSSGLGEMVKLYKDLADKGGAMMIAGASDRIQSLFELAGMSQLLDFVATEGDAAELLQR